MAKKWNSKSTVLAIAVFMLLLWMPIIQMTFSLFPKISGNENRNLAKKPELRELNFQAVLSYKDNFERYFNDHFGFRTLLVRLNSVIHVRLIGMSPTERVILGRQGWLFYNDPYEGVNLKDYTGEAPLRPEELSLIKQNLSLLNKQLKAQGVHFMLVIAPNKHTIYPEYLPVSLIRKKGKTTRADQVCAYLKSSGIDVVDLREKLLSNKGRYPYPLYYPTDTHWNSLGAFLGYEEIIRRVRNRYPKVRPLKLSDFAIHPVDMAAGDLCNFMNMQGLIFDREIALQPKIGIRARPVPSPYDLIPGRDPVGTEVPDRSLPRLVMFRDSFAGMLIPYLSEHFSRSTYLCGKVDLELIRREAPDIVIYELVERKLGSLSSMLD